MRGAKAVVITKGVEKHDFGERAKAVWSCAPSACVLESHP